MKSLLIAALLGATQVSAFMNQAGCVKLDTGKTFDATIDYFPEKTVAGYSTKWEVEYATHYKTVTLVGLGKTYQLVQCFEDATANAASIANAPACEAAAGCYRYQIPITAASVTDSEVLGFFDELGILDRVDASGINTPVSPCYVAKTNTFNPVATFSIAPADNSQVDYSTTISMPLNQETTILARAEYAEFVSVFTNKEGWANYIVSRVVQSSEIQSSLLTSRLPADAAKPAAVWIKSISDTGVASFRSDAWLKQLMDTAKVTLLSFESQDLARTDAAFTTFMTDADVVIVETPSLTSSAALIEKLGLSTTTTTYKFITSSTNYIFQVDKIKSSTSISSDFVEHAIVAPDLLLSDILSAVSHHSTRVSVAPWNTVKRVYLRLASELPRVPDVLTDQHKAQCSIADGRVRPDGISEIRASVLVGLNSVISNLQSPVTAFDATTDYFPQKVRPKYAEHFSVTYHLNWKLVRNLNTARTASNPHRADTILIMKGTHAPSTDILPWAVRIYIPVEKVGFASSTDYAIALLLKRLHTGTAGKAPIPCVLHLRSTNQVIDMPWGNNAPAEAISDVVFSSTASDKNVMSTATSERGLLERAEWLFFFSAFYNLESSASSTFSEILTRYFCVQAKGDSRNSMSTKPRVVVLSYWNGAYTFSRAHYQIEAITTAGGIVANEDPQNSAYLPNLQPGVGTTFNDIDSFKAALVDVDIIIGTIYLSTNTATTPATFDEILAKIGLTQADLTGKQWFQYDKRMDDAGYSDYFTRATVEVDAYLEDYISMFHPGSLPNHERFFFRDMFNNEAVVPVTKEQCPYQGDGALPVDVSAEVATPIAHLSVCITQCTERYNQQYCQQGDRCVWENDACVPAATPAPDTPVPSTLVPSAPVPVPAEDLVPAGTTSGFIMDISVKISGDLQTIAGSTTEMSSMISGNLRADRAPCKEICEEGTSNCFTCGGNAFSSNQRGQTLATTYVIVFQVGTTLSSSEVSSTVSSLVQNFVTANNLGTYEGITVIVVSTYGSTSSDDDISDAAIAGIVVGSVCFVFIVVALVCIFCCRKSEEANEVDGASELDGVDEMDAPDC
eukprot:TRINITY_DN510_c3_g1_i1.p1 TRINITY_DN510_c3_g1~~TRINITY_DN510_c3_g1_i1.p1  ORF type:complete len:1076 (+),score=234.92 TRINITY_DN510_c3_g1_i1:72-3299(+)